MLMESLDDNFGIWNNFWNYYKNYDSTNFSKGIGKLIYDKKNFFVFLYGIHDNKGFSWCSDCRTSEPFVNNAKATIAKLESKKETYFVNIPVERENKHIYVSNNIIQLAHVPTLIYFEKGKEKYRICENEMITQEMIDSFIMKAYQDVL